MRLRNDHISKLDVSVQSFHLIVMPVNNYYCYIAGVFPATVRPFISSFMVTWHLTMKLFPTKCPERATLRKLWRQTGNSSLLPAKCWPLLHVIRACSWRWPDFVAGIPARFSKFAFVLFCYITNHLMTGPLENSEFCFPRISISTSSRETFTVPLGTSH